MESAIPRYRISADEPRTWAARPPAFSNLVTGTLGRYIDPDNEVAYSLAELVWKRQVSMTVWRLVDRP
jgi:hypothetical protein